MACQWSNRPYNWPTQLYRLSLFGTALNFLPSTGLTYAILSKNSGEVMNNDLYFAVDHHLQ